MLRLHFPKVGLHIWCTNSKWNRKGAVKLTHRMKAKLMCSRAAKKLVGCPRRNTQSNEKTIVCKLSGSAEKYLVMNRYTENARFCWACSKEAVHR